MYNIDNVFFKIIQGEIASDLVYQDEYLIAFYDINPSADVHILVIPKRCCISFSDFITESTDVEISHYFRVVKNIAESYCKNGYKLITNNGKGAGQEVFHFHTHILSGISSK